MSEPTKQPDPQQPILDEELEELLSREYHQDDEEPEGFGALTVEQFDKVVNMMMAVALKAEKH